MTPAELRDRLAVFAQEVARFGRPLLHATDTREAALQLKAASSSAAANHRAAGKARTRREFVAKLGIAREEADEAVFWIEHLVGSDAVSAPAAASILREGKELASILAASYRTAASRN
jgi:four helix bundle protein